MPNDGLREEAKEPESGINSLGRRPKKAGETSEFSIVVHQLGQAEDTRRALTICLDRVFVDGFTDLETCTSSVAIPERAHETGNWIFDEEVTLEEEVAPAEEEEEEEEAYEDDEELFSGGFISMERSGLPPLKRRPNHGVRKKAPKWTR